MRVRKKEREFDIAEKNERVLLLRIDFVFAVLAAVALTAPDVSAMGSDSSPKLPTARENFEIGRAHV